MKPAGALSLPPRAWFSWSSLTFRILYTQTCLIGNKLGDRNHRGVVADARGALPVVLVDAVLADSRGVNVPVIVVYHMVRGSGSMDGRAIPCCDPTTTLFRLGLRLSLPVQ